MNRIPAIDNLRGLVMVLMTLDHTRDFFSNDAFNPLDLSQTYPALFLTRWITHFCAPVFIFLAGMSAYLTGGRIGKHQLSRFLLMRGLWIALLGITFESMVWSYTPDFSVFSGSVLWAIGWSMICLALLVFLPFPGIVALSVVMIAGHNALDSVSQQDVGSFGPLWAILHTGEKIRLTQHLVFEPYYPLIPWLGVMALGFSFGALMLLPEAERNRKLYGIGMSLMVMFIVLRASNLYGDPVPWTQQPTYLFTLFSFINCDKYPPSLCYLLMTLGPAIAVLPLIGKLSGKPAAVLQVFGQTPMFFYLLHLPLIILLSLLNAWMVTEPGAPIGLNLFDNFPKTYGYGLPIVYLVWILVLSLLYPVCNKFRALKQWNSHRFLKYL
jgi:uncharacterized membrane protein